MLDISSDIFFSSFSQFASISDSSSDLMHVIKFSISCVLRVYHWVRFFSKIVLLLTFKQTD